MLKTLYSESSFLIVLKYVTSFQSYHDNIFSKFGHEKLIMNNFFFSHVFCNTERSLDFEIVHDT